MGYSRPESSDVLPEDDELSGELLSGAEVLGVEEQLLSFRLFPPPALRGLSTHTCELLSGPEVSGVKEQDLSFRLFPPSALRGSSTHKRCKHFCLSLFAPPNFALSLKIKRLVFNLDRLFLTCKTCRSYSHISWHIPNKSRRQSEQSVFLLLQPVLVAKTSGGWRIQQHVSHWQQVLQKDPTVAHWRLLRCRHQKNLQTFVEDQNQHHSKMLGQWAGEASLSVRERKGRQWGGEAPQRVPERQGLRWGEEAPLRGRERKGEQWGGDSPLCVRERNGQQ